MKTRTYRVITPHETEFADPITFRKGAILEIGEESEGYQGWENWFFCTTAGEEPGWVPGQIIERGEGSTGRALEDYTARELNVQKGETLAGARVLNGWLWCERWGVPEDAGWVPLQNLEEIPD
ncbi:hypothetical protein SAMN05920897_11827 [Alkalispirochaeta americana]|uniref:SH3 domain-containing protein n=1 Tax=Alkalispirochaeta americana TaxID=159291 RepID=A0A1N6WNZ0_9SPIO|nr:SH3 domain-containing protein [Alkalispirochaeta americana]SIQ91775.1 hypothetical protein SAMN05920897_11827 [Alkalispirochaeta americana]